MLIKLLLVICCLLVSLSYGVNINNGGGAALPNDVESYTYSKDAGMADLKFTATTDSSGGGSGSGTSGCNYSGESAKKNNGGGAALPNDVESYTYSKDAGMADLKFTATTDSTGDNSGGSSGCNHHHHHKEEAKTSSTTSSSVTYYH